MQCTKPENTWNYKDFSRKTRKGTKTPLQLEVVVSKILTIKKKQQSKLVEVANETTLRQMTGEIRNTSQWVFKGRLAVFLNKLGIQHTITKQFEKLQRGWDFKKWVSSWEKLYPRTNFQQEDWHLTFLGFFDTDTKIIFKTYASSSWFKRPPSCNISIILNLLFSFTWEITKSSIIKKD